MKINKHPKFKIMMKDGKEMLLFFKSAKIREDEVSDQLIRDFENKKYEVDLTIAIVRRILNKGLSTLILMIAKSTMY